MAITKINPLEVGSRVDDIKSELNRHWQSILEAEQLITHLGGIWESPTQRVYAENFNRSKSEVRRFLDAMQNYLSEIKETAIEFDNTDSDIANALRNLSPANYRV